MSDVQMTNHCRIYSVAKSGMAPDQNEKRGTPNRRSPFFANCDSKLVLQSRSIADSRDISVLAGQRRVALQDTVGGDTEAA